MYDEFSPAGKRVMESTQTIAFGLGHNYVGTEHLLLAVLAEEERVGDGPLVATGVTTASVIELVHAQLAKFPSDADALRSIGLDPAAVSQAAKASLGLDVKIQGLEEPPIGAFTPRAFKVAHIAIGIAATAPVEPRHVLQAILEEDGGLAVVVLDKLGVDLVELHSLLSQ